MRLLAAVLTATVLVFITGCGGGEVDTGLLGRLPQGYDAYITFDPELIGLEDLLSTVEDNLSDRVLGDIEDSDIPLDPFEWSEWKEEMGLEEGEIGVIGLSEDMDFLALFLPCGDGEKLREFVENAEGTGDAEFLVMDEYTVMVISWDDDDQIDDLEDALEEEPLASDERFAAMSEKAILDNTAVAFVFFEEITEVPIAVFVSRSSSATEVSLAVIMDDEEINEYSGMFGDGLQSGNIRFPENTMAATRTTIDMEWLLSEYDELAGASEADMRDMETGMAMFGFDSMEEFIGIFKGDFCFALTGLEFDSSGDIQDGEGLIAFSLNDSEQLEASLNMISAMAEAERESYGDVTAYLVQEGLGDHWFFIHDDVFYVTMNIEPDDIMDGIEAGDFFQGTASEGFMGGAADPEAVFDGISVDGDTEDLLRDVFADTAEFSVHFDGEVAYSKVTAGPNAIEAMTIFALAYDQ